MPKKIPLVLIALGGNVLTRKHETGKIEEQRENADQICSVLIPLIEQGNHIVITHGNGPQVGSILIQNEQAENIVPAMPLDVLVAQSEGNMGYLFQQSLLNHLRKKNIKRYVVTMITQVLVDSKDNRFSHPRKPIGPFYSEKKAKELTKKKKWEMIEDAGRGYRRVVPSPKPIKVIQRHMIKDLAEKGNIVIALGGGGIPIIKNNKDEYVGIEAVIDKDLASANLAKEIKADMMVILTNVDKVAINFNKPNQKDLDMVTVKDAKKYLAEGHFLEGSMKPKIESAIEFLENRDGKVIITSPEKLHLALKNKSGTRIIRKTRKG